MTDNAATHGGGDETLTPGTMVGEFRIEAKIGQGGMGTVYSALQPVIGKRAAVKVISRELCARPNAVQRFIREAQAVNQISHSNIVDIFSLGTLPDGRPYFIMELLRGELLADRLRRGRLSLQESAEFLTQICRALEATHQQGIIHRDLKPENVFIDMRTGTGTIKILDFGIAKLDAAEMAGAERLTRDGSTMGTPAYLSPEVARGQLVDARSDIYSLGVMAYEMILGRVPFTGASAIDTITMHLGSRPPTPRSLWPGISPELEQILLGMLEKDPNQRPTLARVRLVVSNVGNAQIAPSNASPLRVEPLASLTPPALSLAATQHVSTNPSSSGQIGSAGGLDQTGNKYRCKGSHVIVAQKWVDERLGPGAFKALVKDAGDVWRGMYLPMTWFDVFPLNNALIVVAHKLNRSLEDVTMEITRLNALEDLTSMYRFFLRIAAPQRVMSFTPRLWSTYVEFGVATAIKNEPGHYVGECTGIPERLLQWSCGAWRGFVPTAIELAGGKNVRGTIRGTWRMNQGDLHRLECEILYSTV